MSEIDVSKCRFRDNFYGTCKATKDGDGECEIPCFDYKNCYYKQLQQFKAENKELTERFDAEMLKVTQLATENVELRKENQKMYKMGCKNFVAIDQAKRLYKLNKCIDDIKGIINDFADKDIITFPDYIKTALPSTTKNYKMIAEQYAKPIKQILQKIKEVKGE